MKGISLHEGDLSDLHEGDLSKRNRLCCDLVEIGPRFLLIAPLLFLHGTRFLLTTDIFTCDLCIGYDHCVLYSLCKVFL